MAKCKCDHNEFCPVCIPEVAIFLCPNCAAKDTDMDSMRARMERLGDERDRLAKDAHSLRAALAALEQRCGDVEGMAKVIVGAARPWHPDDVEGEWERRISRAVSEYLLEDKK